MYLLRSSTGPLRGPMEVRDYIHLPEATAEAAAVAAAAQAAAPAADPWIHLFYHEPYLVI